MRVLFFAIALAALAIGVWNTSELMRADKFGNTASRADAGTSGDTDKTLENRLAQFEESLLELAAAQQSTGQSTGQASGNSDLNARIAKLEQNAQDTPSTFDGAELFQGMAELAGRLSKLESASGTPIGNTSSAPKNDEKLTALAQRISKLESEKPPSDNNLGELFEGLAIMNAKLQALENSKPATTPSNPQPQATAPVTPSNEQITNSIRTLEAELGARIAKLENAQAPAVQNSPDTAQKLATLTSRLEKLETTEPRNNTEMEELFEGFAAMNAKLQSLEKSKSAAAPSNQQPQDAATIQKQITSAMKLLEAELGARIAKLETTPVPAVQNSPDTVQKLATLTSRLNTLENAKPKNSGELEVLFEGVATMNAKLQDMDKRLQQPSSTPATTGGGDALVKLANRLEALEDKQRSPNNNLEEIFTGIAQINTKLKQLEETSPAANAPDKDDQLSTRLDQIESELANSKTDTASLPSSKNLIARLDNQEAQIAKLLSIATPSPDTDLKDTLGLLVNRVAALEQRPVASPSAPESDDSDLDEGINEIRSQIATLTSRLATQETLFAQLGDQEAPIAKTEFVKITREISGKVDQLSSEIDNVKKTRQQSPAKPEPSKTREELNALIFQVSGLDARLRELALQLEDNSGLNQLDQKLRSLEQNLENKNATNDIDQQIAQNAQSIAALESALTKDDNAVVIEQLSVGVTQLAQRLSTLEGKGGTSQETNLGFDADALFEGMATLAHRIAQLEEKFK